MRQTASGEHVVIDFDGIDALSPSFADEIFGKLPTEAGDRVKFVNLGPAMQTMASIAKKGRS